jgi:hypothetical protein
MSATESGAPRALSIAARFENASRLGGVMSCMQAMSRSWSRTKDSISSSPMILSSAKNLSELPAALDEVRRVLELGAGDAPVAHHDFSQTILFEARAGAHDETRAEVDRAAGFSRFARENTRALAAIELLEGVRDLVVHEKAAGSCFPAIEKS